MCLHVFCLVATSTCCCSPVSARHSDRGCHVACAGLRCMPNSSTWYCATCSRGAQAKAGGQGRLAKLSTVAAADSDSEDDAAVKVGRVCSTRHTVKHAWLRPTRTAAASKQPCIGFHQVDAALGKQDEAVGGYQAPGSSSAHAARRCALVTLAMMAWTAHPLLLRVDMAMSAIQQLAQRACRAAGKRPHSVSLCRCPALPLCS
jgi:hypothetical protein